MLDHEYWLLLERLDATRGDNTAFFVFANTVATHSYSHRDEGHGWLGLRFQSAPRTEPSDIIVHIRLFDTDNVREQEALGILGVNLIHGAFYHNDAPEQLIGALLDDLTRDRVELDMVEFSGPAFATVDNRLMALQLVAQGLSDAALFTVDGQVVQAGEVLYQKPVLIERGSFRPVTNVTHAMLESALAQLRQDPKLDGEEPVVLMEMTLRNLAAENEQIDHTDFLARVDILGTLGKMVMISNYARFHRVTQYLRRHTQNRIAMAVGVPTELSIFDDKYYTDLEGGILEAFGRLFKGDVKLYVYPAKNPHTGELVTADILKVPGHLRHLYAHLLENELIESIRDFDPGQLGIYPRDVLAKLQSGDSSWEKMVPASVAAIIKDRNLFGYRGQ